MLSMLDKILQAILKMLKKKDERVLLWKNASPTSEFVAQTLLIPWQDYAMLYVEYDYTTTGNKDKTSMMIPCVQNHILHADYVYLSESSVPKFAERNITCVASGIKFDGGWYGLANTKAAANAACLIPLTIYGVKSSGGGKLVSLFRKLLTRGGVRYGY